MRTVDSPAQGQWALGFREPLNPAELAKREDDGLNVRARIEGIYAQGGFGSIWPSDLRNRFRWYGLYTQRPEADGYFMLRIRIPGGVLTSGQTDVIGAISQRYGRDVADVTDRQNIQLHWIRIEDVPEIWGRLEAVGLSTTEACGDTPRNILGCPLAGIDASEVVDASAALREANAQLVGNPSSRTCRANSRSRCRDAHTGAPSTRSTTSAWWAPSAKRASPASTSGSAGG